MFSRDTIQPADTLAEVLLAIRATQDPSAPGLTFYDGAERSGSLSYGEYLDRIDAYAAYLRAQGVSRGDKVGTFLRNRLEVPVLYLAAMSIGAVVVPLNPSYSAQELRYVLEDAAPVLVVTDTATGAERVGEIAAVSPVRVLEQITLGTGTPPVASTVGRDDPAIILYTSGTTSFPKGVVQTHGNLVANAWSMLKEFGIDRPVQYSVMPFYHAHAVGFGMMTCLLGSGHLVVTDRMNPLVWARVISAEGVTLTSMVPSMLQVLLRMRVTAEALPTLAFVFVSAAPLPSLVAQQFERESGIRIAHAWGLSEFTNFATAIAVDVDPSVREPLLFGRSTPCVGSALSGVDVRVVRADGSPADPEELGELQVAGPSLTLGYHGNPEATELVFRDGWLSTGDEGYYVRVDGTSYFFVTDRIKDIIIRSGEKISPAAVESLIVAELPHLAGKVVALGYANQTYGEEVGLVVDCPDIDVEREALMALVQTIPVRMRPKVVLWGDEIIPRTHTGKTQRRMLVHHFAPYERTGGSGTLARITATET